MNDVVKLNSRCGPRSMWTLYAETLAAGKPFTTPTGYLRGERHTPGVHVRRGWLDERHAATLDDADYVVWSFDTPIAWHVPQWTGRTGWQGRRARWHVPAVHHSQTTTVHQGKILTAVTSVTATWGDAPVIR